MLAIIIYVALFIIIINAAFKGWDELKDRFFNK